MRALLSLAQLNATKNNRCLDRGMSRLQHDVVIVGGGVIGLSVAYALSREGIRATLLDRREFGREASWAGAGMLPPCSERPPAQPFELLRSWSARLYPKWSDALREETGIDNGFRRTGGVDVAWTEDEENALRTSAGRWRSDGIVFERLAPGDYVRVEPALNPSLRVVYYLPDRSQIRNPWHLEALKTAIEARGVRLRPGEAVVGFETAGGRVTAVRTEHGRIPCGQVIVTAGAWSAGLLEMLGIQVPTPPVKGQIVLLRCQGMVLRRIVEHGRMYLVPRDDGRVLIGATEEDAGFDTRPTTQGVRDLLDEAIRLVPALADAEVERAWAGLRPGSIDSRPYLGTVPDFPNLLVATGHKRSGLQLSPATAEAITDLVLDRPARIDLSLFRIDREPAPASDDVFRS
ncbi:glycine oxidase ThiO [Singulisphaera acidiphila DSM 18658]|uniref:Glycine oxidase ThiO n=2 Tax=Singulisphaera acidiphila TaxID=466153 RepID=L0DKJ0_SINAD|nr:glycine oxidase ThiO [Singulisphaera acidiphila DSM 18658]